MDYTTNLNLKKPNGEVDGDFADIADINENMEIIDGAVSDHIADTANPHSVTKTQVGLGNVDNVSVSGHLSDTDLHVTALKQEEWDGKADRMAIINQNRKLRMGGM